MQGWLTTKELAERSGTTQARIRQLCIAGKLKADKRGRDWLISAEDARRWLDSRKERNQGRRIPGE